MLHVTVRVIPFSVIAFLGLAGDFRRVVRISRICQCSSNLPIALGIRLTPYSVVGLVDTITGIDPVGNSSRSERTRAIETPCAYLLVFHTAHEDDGTDSSTRRFVPRPSAIVPNRCHVPYCALRGEAGCGGHAEHGGFFLRRRPCPPVRNRGTRPTTQSLERRNGIEQW
jgi:hypothetical protein